MATLIKAGTKRHQYFKFVNNDEDPNIIRHKSQKILKEIVFYSNKANHEKGTNLYTFEHAPQWRTSNIDKEIGIRGIYLKKSPRTLKWSITFGDLQSSSEHELVTDWYFLLKFHHTIDDFIIYLNNRIKELIDGFFWEYVPEFDAIVLDRLDSAVYAMTVIDSTHSFDPIGKIESKNNKIFINMWNRNELLLKSNISELDNSHLGYTDTSYSPLKMFYLNPPIPISFTVELFDSSTLNPVELPEDGKDYIVIEAVIRLF
jgi:hypothetical protein